MDRDLPAEWRHAYRRECVLPKHRQQRTHMLTCHQPQNGWTISAAGAQARFDASSGTEPLFRLVDGATCPTAKVTTLKDRRQAYKLLTDKGLIRIGIQLPDNVQFEVISVSDPYNCTTNPATGLTSKTTGVM